MIHSHCLKKLDPIPSEHNGDHQIKVFDKDQTGIFMLQLTASSRHPDTQVVSPRPANSLKLSPLAQFLNCVSIMAQINFHFLKEAFLDLLTMIPISFSQRTPMVFFWVPGKIQCNLLKQFQEILVQRHFWIKTFNLLFHPHPKHWLPLINSNILSHLLNFNRYPRVNYNGWSRRSILNLN